jgi:hypothetical protein
MRWLLHGTLTDAVGEALRRHGHSTVGPPDLQLAPDAPPADVLKAAQAKQLDLLTSDAKLSAAPFEEQIAFPRTLVYLQLEGGDVEQDDAVDRLFERYKRLSPGRMYTVTGSRVKIRQLPGGKR